MDMQVQRPAVTIPPREQVTNVTLFNIFHSFSLTTYLIFELGNTFGASKTGFRAGNTTGWRDQHLDSSMPESMDEEEQALMS